MIDPMHGETQTSSGTLAIELAARDAFDNCRNSWVLDSSKVVTVEGQRYEVRVKKIVELVSGPLVVAGRATI